ncbi:MAG: hypothetical protein ABUT20_26800 [Bacteroidota bacterium]
MTSLYLRGKEERGNNRITFRTNKVSYTPKDFICFSEVNMNVIAYDVKNEFAIVTIDLFTE